MILSQIKALVVIAVFATLAACGGSGHTCDQSAANKICYEYTGTNAQVVAAAVCTSVGTAGSSCPSASRLGRCTTSESGRTSILHYYTGNSSTAAALETSCKGSSGTWTTN